MPSPPDPNALPVDANVDTRLSATLDPVDWDPVRLVGRQMVDDLVGYLDTVRDRPTWQSVPAAVRARLDEAVPREGQPLEAVYDQFREQVLPYATGNIHPRFWGWVMGTGSATAMLADMLASGMNCHLADSLAFDLHKWGYLPYEVGVILTRSPHAQTATYQAPPSAMPAYLQSATGGISTGTTYFADRGMSLSRGFKALKVWMAMKEQGVTRIGKAIQANIDQARYLGGLVDADPMLDRMAPVSLNAVCFRYLAKGLDAEGLDQLNREILITLQEEGVAVPSQTILGGRYAIRCCITNHRSRAEDFDILVDAVRRIGARLTGPAEALR